MASVWVPDHARHTVIVVTSWVTGGWGLEGVGICEVSVLVASAVQVVALRRYVVAALIVKGVAAPYLSLVGGRGVLCSGRTLHMNVTTPCSD